MPSLRPYEIPPTLRAIRVSPRSTIPIPSYSLPTHVPPRCLRTKLVCAEEEDGLVDLESQDLGLDEGERLAVDLDKALARLAVGDCGGSLLFAEALNALDGRHDGWLGSCRLGGRVWSSLSRICVRS